MTLSYLGKWGPSDTTKDTGSGTWVWQSRSRATSGGTVLPAKERASAQLTHVREITTFMLYKVKIRKYKAGKLKALLYSHSSGSATWNHLWCFLPAVFLQTETSVHFFTFSFPPSYLLSLVPPSTFLSLKMTLSYTLLGNALQTSYSISPYLPF